MDLEIADKMQHPTVKMMDLAPSELDSMKYTTANVHLMVAK